MPRRDEYGRFQSDDDDDRYGRGTSRRYEDDDDWRTRSGFRSQGGRGGSRWDEEEYERGGTGREFGFGRGRGRYEEDRPGGFRSHGGSSRYEDDDDDRFGRGSSRRGFASMDPEEHREISRRGGEARWYGSSGGRGRYEDDEEERFGRFRGGSSRGFSFADMDPEERREMARRGAEARWYGSSGGGRGGRFEEDDDDDRFGRGRSGSSRRGFASMDPEERREIARQGAEARWYGSSRGRSTRDDDDDDDDRARGRGSSRRGFAGMDPEEHRRISRMGGQASHGGR